MRKTLASIAVLTAALAAALALAGCAILFPSAEQRATKDTPGFKAGFNDGCAASSTVSADYSAEKFRDKASYDSDPNYRAGWANGLHNCRRTDAVPNPNAGPVPDVTPGSTRY
jgi:hypothetical protein